MYIRRKVFSSLMTEEGEERLFSTTDYVYEDERDSHKKKGGHRVSLSDDKVNSHRGLGRSYLVGGFGGAIGGYAGKRAAEKADAEGLSDREILDRSQKKGAVVGGALGGAIGGLATLRRGAKIGGSKLGGAAVGTGLGALSGYLGGKLGAKKNTKVRLQKRRELGSKN